MPARIADSRANLQIAGAVSASGTVTVQVTGRGGIPATGVATAILTVTAVGPRAPGYLTVMPGGVARGATSSLNFSAGFDVPNTMITPVGANGAIQVFNGSAGAVHIVVDVSGYTVAGTPRAPGAVVPVTPTRIADSSKNLQVSGSVPASGTTRIQVAGRGGVPSNGIAAAILNVTVADPQAAGYLTAWPSGLPRRGTSSLNFAASTNVANSIVVPVGTDGAVQVFNGSKGRVGAAGRRHRLHSCR